MPILDLDIPADTSRIRAQLSGGAPLVACLCAEWCGSCREYRDVFTQLSEIFPDLCFIWIDIENQADLMDNFDVENFPTIVIEDQEATRFAGTVLPQRGILERLLGQFTELPAVIGAIPLRARLAL